MKISKPLKKLFSRSFVLGTLTLSSGLLYAQQLGVGDKPPIIRVGKWVKGSPLRAFYPGTTYVVEFFVSGSEACKQSFPKLAALANDPLARIQVLAIDVAEDDTAKAEPFIQQMGDAMDFSVAIDKQPTPTSKTGYMRENWMTAAYQRDLPTLFVIGKTGEIEFIGSFFEMEQAHVMDKLKSGAWAAEKAKIVADRANFAKDSEEWYGTLLGATGWNISTLIDSERYKEALKTIQFYSDMEGGKWAADPKMNAFKWELLCYTKLGDMDGYYATANAEYAYLEDGKDIDQFNSGLSADLSWPIVDPTSTLPKKDYAFALKAAKRLVDLDGRKHHYFIDTLAWAYYWNGDKADAVATEQEALKLAPMQEEYKKTLAKFSEGLPANSKPVVDTPSPTAITDDEKSTVLKQLSHTLWTKAFLPNVDFTSWQVFLESEKKNIDSAKSKDAFVTNVNSALKRFGVSHTKLYSPQKASQIGGQDTGIGVVLERDGTGVHVLRTITGAPAEKAGVQAGDTVLSMDGAAPEPPADKRESGPMTWTPNAPENSTVKLKARHPNGADATFTITCAAYDNIVPDTLTWLNPQTAVVRIPTLLTGYDTAKIEDLMKQAAKAPYLILDLRGNPGGFGPNAEHLMGLFLPPGTCIGYDIDRPSYETYRKDHSAGTTDLADIARTEKPQPMIAKESSVPYFKGRVAVLIDEHTGSAAEICAQALKSDIKALAVGQKSAGAVLGANFQPLPFGYEMIYPDLYFLTADYMVLEGKGVVPDQVATALSPYGKPDEAIAQAATALGSK